MPEITEEQLAKWSALCDAATPEPWKHGPESHGVYNPDMGSPLVVKPIVEEARNPDDAAFIAAARTAMPALIAALREARAELDYFRDRCNRHAAARDLAEEGREAEREKVKRLRWALESFDCCPHCHHARCDNCDDLSARVLKETE